MLGKSLLINFHTLHVFSSLSFRNLVPDTSIPHDFDCELSEAETTRFLALNPKPVLESLKAEIIFDSIAPAKLFMNTLADSGHCKSMGNIMVRAGVEEVPGEPRALFTIRLADLIKEMVAFKKYCGRLRLRGIAVKWGWEKFGILKYMNNEIGHMIEDSDT